MGILMKKVRYNGNPRLTTPAGQSKHTIRGAIVPPENLEKKHTSTIFGAPHQTTPAGQSKYTIRGAIVRPETLGKKHTIQRSLVGWLVGWAVDNPRIGALRGQNVRHNGNPN